MSEMANTAKPHEANKTEKPARRQPWNTSTRPGISVHQRARETEEAQHRTQATGKPRHRCTSPSCQKRCNRAQPVSTSSPTKSGHAVHLTHHQQPAFIPHDDATKDPTQAMIERAFESAMASAMLNDQVDASVEELDEDEDDNGERKPEQRVKTQVGRPKTKSLVDFDASQWRTQYLRYRKQRDEDTQAIDGQHNASLEVHSALGTARIEYDKRKLALQSLRAKVDREILFLQSTASALARREAMMDEAFAVFEQRVRRDLETRHGGARAV